MAHLAPSNNPQVFADRICEARALFDLAKGTRDEERVWRYLSAVVDMARIATSRDELAEVMRAA